MLPEHKVYKVLGGRQGTETGPTADMVQQGGQYGARAAGSSCPFCLLQQLRQVHTGLGEEPGLSRAGSVAFLASSSAITPRVP